MSRRNSGAAEAAANVASEAARVLQQRGQEARAEAASEPAKPANEMLTTDRIEKLRQNSPRNRIMEEIAASRPGGEPAEAPKAGETKPADAPAKAAAAETATEKQAQVTAEAVPAVDPAPAEAPKTVRVKVDGEEFDALASEVEEAGGVKSFQIQRAAENRLTKANATLAEARKAQNDIIQLATALQRPAAPQKAQETDDEFIASKMDAVRFGNPADAAQAMREIMQRGKVDPNSIIEQAASKVKHDEAVAKFDRDFQDISSNPIRLKAAVALRQERLEKHRREAPNQAVDWHSFYLNIGNEVRSAFGGSSQQAAASAGAAATAGNPSPSSDKEARKASIVNLPAAAARAEAPKEDKPQTREDVLDEMRKKRGQAVG